MRSKRQSCRLRPTAGGFSSLAKIYVRNAVPASKGDVKELKFRG